ncbi:hypothetical protein RBI14_23040 [Alcaligenaceae bacterium B3P038]|nr:hypothetical protein [Alcaligenaceae bacterium B3P038]
MFQSFVLVGSEVTLVGYPTQFKYRAREAAKRYAEALNSGRIE